MIKSEILSLFEGISDEEEINLVVYDGQDNWDAKGINIDFFGGDIEKKVIDLTIDLEDGYEVSFTPKIDQVNFSEETRVFSDVDEMGIEMRKGKCFQMKGSRSVFYYEPGFLNGYRVGDLDDNIAITDWFFCDGKTEFIRVSAPD